MGKPIRFEFSEIKKHIRNVKTLFICCASFESRSTIIASKLSNYNFQVLIFKNKVEKNEIDKTIKGKNAKVIASYFQLSLIKDISKHDPFFTFDQMFTTLAELKDNSKQGIRYIVDITTFTHEALLILQKVLNFVVSKKDKIIILYNPANEYSYKNKTLETKWLSKGIREIRSVLGYPGVFSPYKKLHLILLVGFEIEKCIKLIEQYEPSIISIGLPNETNTLNTDIHKLNIERYEKLLSIYPNVNEFTFSCSDPEITKSDIIKLYKKFQDYNTVISPMNNKISTIGVGMFVEEFPAVQISYARARIYNTKEYSQPSNFCIKVEL